MTIGHDITERKSTQNELSIDSAHWASLFLEGTDIREEVFEDVYTLSLELSGEGREGKLIGTTFIVGNANHEIRETVKELSQIDGALVISGDGTIESAG